MRIYDGGNALNKTKAYNEIDGLTKKLLAIDYLCTAKS